MKNQQLEELLINLYQKLQLKFPDYHFAHVDVWSNFWNFIEALGRANIRVKWYEWEKLPESIMKKKEENV